MGHGFLFLYFELFYFSEALSFVLHGSGGMVRPRLSTVMMRRVGVDDKIEETLHFVVS